MAQVAALTYAADMLPRQVAPGDRVQIWGARPGQIVEGLRSVVVEFIATGYAGVQEFEVWNAERFDGSVAIYGEW